jgi:two-component system alkaline phosphatase synthesis response regulator PhoP
VSNDYMTKPFSPQELISRIQSILRRAELFAVTEIGHPIEIGAIRIVPEQREVMVAGNRIELTPKEFELLLFLCKHRGKVLSRQQLLYGVWDYHFFEDIS